jgi:hypothetical protein
MIRTLVRALVWLLAAAIGSLGWALGAQPRVTVFEGFYHPG